MFLDAPVDKSKQRTLALKRASLKTVGDERALPSVRLPGGENEDFTSVLRNTCPSSRALHIQQRCAAIDGKTFQQVKGLEFADSKGKLKPYSVSDIYDTT
jgi:hypothetical protein